MKSVVALCPSNQGSQGQLRARHWRISVHRFTWYTKPGRVTGRVFRGPASRRTLPPSPPVAAPERPDKALVAEERMDGRALPDGTVLQSMPTQPSRPQAIYFARLKSCGAFDRREGLRQVLMWL